MIFLSESQLTLALKGHIMKKARNALGVYGAMLGRLTMKKIRTICDIQAEDVEWKAGTVLEIVEVVEDQIVVRIPEGEYYCMSSEALETGFEIAEN